MMNRVFLILILLLISFFAIGQADSSFSKLSYFNSFHAGGLFGKKGNGSGASFSTIHGIRIEKFAFGIGVGYDAYREWRTLPVFVSLNYDFFRFRGNAFFVQVNAGYSKAWYPLEDGEFIYDNKRGPFLHLLLGYRINAHKFNLYLTAGYKFQTIDYEQTSMWWTWGFPGSRTYVSRDMERISIQLGFGFH
jgi:hypothetical protein